MDTSQNLNISDSSQVQLYPNYYSEQYDTINQTDCFSGLQKRRNLFTQQKIELNNIQLNGDNSFIEMSPKTLHEIKAKPNKR